MTMRIFVEVIKYDLKIPVIQMTAHAQHAWMDVFRRKAFDHGRIFSEKHRMHEGSTVHPAETARPARHGDLSPCRHRSHIQDLKTKPGQDLVDIFDIDDASAVKRFNSSREPDPFRVWR